MASKPRFPAGTVPCQWVPLRNAQWFQAGTITASVGADGYALTILIVVLDVLVLTGGKRMGITSGQVAKRLGCPLWMVRRACERGLLRERGRAGHMRIFHESDLPRIRRVMLEAGYLKQQEVTVTA